MRISDWSSDVCSSDLSSHGRKCSDEGVGAHLVARRVAQICGIGVRQMATRPGRPLIDAARGKTGLMERVDIGLARCRETDGDAVARWGLAVAGREDQERGLVLAVEHDVIAKRAEVRDTEWPERGIVESRRLRQIAGTETCVRSEEHTSELQSLMRI